MIRRPKAPALFSLPQPPQIESVPFARPASLAPYPKTVMTLLGKNKDSPLEQCLLRDGDGSEAGPSGTAPPSFEESAGHLVVTFDDAVDNFPTGGEEPPDFTPYEAEHWVSRSGDIISHDSHLNEDGVWRLVILVSLLHVFTSDLDRRSSLSLLTFTGRDATNLRRPLLRHA